MTEQMDLSGDVGRWTLDRAPTHAEALLKAAECASAAGDPTIGVAAGRNRAEQAKAWAAIANAVWTAAEEVFGD